MKFRLFIIGLVLSLTASAQRGTSQESYQILATKKDRFGLLRTPHERQLQIGQEFLLKRLIDGVEKDAARVRVALVEKKYTGVRVVEAFLEPPIEKGDVLMLESPLADSKFEAFKNRLQTLEATPVNRPKQDRERESAPPLFAQKNAATASPPSNGKAAAAPPEPQQEIVGDSAKLWMAFKSNDVNPPDRPDSQEIVLHDDARTYFGPMVSGFIPVSNTTDVFASGPQAGFQVITPFYWNMSLRITLQGALPGTSVKLKNANKAVPFWQNTHLGFMTASLQPPIGDAFYFDLGAGIFRQEIARFEKGVLTNSAANAAGGVGGVGWRTNLRGANRLMVMALGHVYFPKGGNTPFLNLTASYLFSF